MIRARVTKNDRWNKLGQYIVAYIQLKELIETSPLNKSIFMILAARTHMYQYSFLHFI
jgi:hypothetical protein